MRKLVLLAIMAAIWPYRLPAQIPVADSLLSLLQVHTQDDSTKINLLTDLAKAWRRSHIPQRDSLLELASTLSNRLNYAKGKGNVLAIKGILYGDELKHAEAKKSFEESYRLLQSVGDKKDLAYMLRMWGSLSMDEGDYAKSLDQLLQGLKLAQEVGDTKTVINIEGYTGYLYNILGEYDKAIPYQTDALKQAESIGYPSGMSGAYNAIGKTYKTKGDYPPSLDAYTKGLRIDEMLKDAINVAIDHGNIADVYERMGKFPDAFENIKAYLDYLQAKAGPKEVAWGEWVLGKAYTHSGDAVQGLHFAKHSLALANQVGWRLYLREITSLIAESAAKLKQWDTAYKYQVLSSAYKDSLTGQETARKTTMLQASFELDKKQAQIALLTKDQALQAAESRRERAFLYAVLGGLALVLVMAVILFRNNRQKQQANMLLQKQKEEIDGKAKELALQKANLEQSYTNIELLGEIGRKITSSLSVERIISTVYDNVNSLMDASIFGIGIYNESLKRIEFPATYEKGEALAFYTNSLSDKNRFAVSCFTSRKEIVMGELGKEYQDYVQHMPTPAVGEQPVSLIFLPLLAKERILGVITVQSFQLRAYSDYHLYMLRNIAIYTAIALENAESFGKLNQTIVVLKNTQAQLIQSEKMASLGELTAGIAHEIQNPLNFVNNFSDLNSELADEMKSELTAGNLPAAIALADSIRDNNEKITYHGKRADSIVKGMLQHSRHSSGEKELTDINALVDECLRLSFHGMRAKDKTFNSKMEELLDPELPQINIVSQDIGRVLLNLCTNSFYAVAQKKKQAGGSYEPCVTVKTMRTADGTIISVKDNGMGVPMRVLDKIFQPFFTTKPSGEGTGLGLSMSYDIITKGHGGELKVETKEGEYAEFIIHLPAKN